MSRLCAPFTILAAITAFGVDDGTSVELIPHKMAGDLVGGLVKCLFVRVIAKLKACSSVIFLPSRMYCFASSIVIFSHLIILRIYTQL